MTWLSPAFPVGAFSYSHGLEWVVEEGLVPDEARLAAWIERRGGTTTARDLIAACRWIATSDEAEAALRRLVAAGRGEWHDRPPSERGGRPTRDFVLRRQPAVEAREPLQPKPASAKPREEAAKRGFGCADADAVAQKPAAEPEEAIEI
jgi:urease accessory protein UreF